MAEMAEMERMVRWCAKRSLRGGWARCEVGVEGGEGAEGRERGVGM